MAAPVISARLWNPTTNILQILSDTNLTFAGAVHDFQLTDANGALWANASAAFASGSGGLIPTVQLSLYPAGTPGTVSTLDMAAGAVTNGTVSDASADASYVLALDHAAPYSRTDVAALFTAIANIITNGTSIYDTLALADVSLLSTHLLSSSPGILATAPRTIAQAQAFVDAADSFDKSSRDAFALQDFRRAATALRATLPVRGTVAISSAGT